MPLAFGIYDYVRFLDWFRPCMGWPLDWGHSLTTLTHAIVLALCLYGNDCNKKICTLCQSSWRLLDTQTFWHRQTLSFTSVIPDELCLSMLHSYSISLTHVGDLCFLSRPLRPLRGRSRAKKWWRNGVAFSIRDRCGKNKANTHKSRAGCNLRWLKMTCYESKWPKMMQNG